jgi:glycosyltransferase involved in cell wall biosynthesis
MSSHDSSPLELTVVMPCLNEADTLAACVRRALAAMKEAGIVGEVVVADNGSTDGSREIATAEGARLVPVPDRGYGAALMGGIEAARGRFIVMGDADESYDFGEVPTLVERLREGYELVQGCRLRAGGGRILPGAMPRLHRWLGNPMFSRIARRWFRAPVHDIYCGLRGFTKSLYLRLDQRCTGMEFATEMIIKASLLGARIGEVPITLHPDGRKQHPPHLKTFRDGWRTLRFFLMCTPRRLFLRPGLILLTAGLAGYTVAMPGLRLRGMTFDAHTLLFASLAVICGYQSMLFAFIAKTFAITEGVLPPDPRVDRMTRILPLSRGLLLGLSAAAVGGVMLIAAVNTWRVSDFGPLNYADTMRVVVPGVTLAVLGYQTILSCLFLNLLQMRRR